MLSYCTVWTSGFFSVFSFLSHLASAVVPGQPGQSLPVQLSVSIDLGIKASALVAFQSTCRHKASQETCMLDLNRKQMMCQVNIGVCLFLFFKAPV